MAGVSGSGKSSLIADTLVPALERKLGGALVFSADAESDAPGSASTARLSGDLPAGIEFVDQSSLGRTTRGNPASYVGAFTAIREFFGTSPEAIVAGLKPGDFSFNSGAGRCPRCAGTGWEHVEMQFLSDVYLPCPDCGGKRYQEKILRIRPTLDNGKTLSISAVLDLTVDEALEAFSRHAAVVKPLKVLQLTGLGYLKLGQPLTTLSGGESFPRALRKGCLPCAVRRARFSYSTNPRPGFTLPTLQSSSTSSTGSPPWATPSS